MRPVLWHIAISHFSEKARWALAFKRVEHERRAPLPGAHVLWALWLTRGRSGTFPILRLDGRTLADSTAIIAALEELRPEPPLYPAEPGARARALALEEWFDERLGPQIRRFEWHEVRRDREVLGRITERNLPPRLRRSDAARRAASGFASAFVALRFGAASGRASAGAAREVLAALDRLEAELGDREYLVGDTFTVADLTAAALFYPLVVPPEGPRVPQPPPSLERFRAPLKQRRGYRWVEEMYRRHRRP